jgi:hypothetical protein
LGLVIIGAKNVGYQISELSKTESDAQGSYKPAPLNLLFENDRGISMSLTKIAFTFCTFFFASSANLFAQSAACQNAITNKYSGNYQDRYGNGSSKKIDMLQYYVTNGPGTHKFGNNNALLYIAVVDKYENGQIRDRETVKVWCVVNSAGKVLGIERDFN